MRPDMNLPDIQREPVAVAVDRQRTTEEKIKRRMIGKVFS
jgi:hypothetical protein